MYYMAISRFVNLRFTVEDGASLVFDMPETNFGPNSGVRRPRLVSIPSLLRLEHEAVKPLHVSLFLRQLSSK